MEISQLLKIHKPQTLHLSHAARRKGYSFNVSKILINFQKDQFLPIFYFFEWIRIRERGSLHPNSALRLSAGSYFSLPHFWGHTFNVLRVRSWGPVTRGGGVLTLWEQGFAWLSLACLTLSHQARASSVTPGRERRHEWEEAEILMVWISTPPSPSNMPIFLPWGYWGVQFRKRINKYLLCSFPPLLKCTCCLALHAGTAEGCLFQLFLYAKALISVGLDLGAAPCGHSAAEKHKTIPAALPTSAGLWQGVRSRCKLKNESLILLLQGRQILNCFKMTLILNLTREFEFLLQNSRNIISPYKSTFSLSLLFSTLCPRKVEISWIGEKKDKKKASRKRMEEKEKITWLRYQSCLLYKTDFKLCSCAWITQGHFVNVEPITSERLPSLFKNHSLQF